ncbi:MAG: hypothetical protein ABR540_09225 [Acidimicrobiales bacterium]
MHPAQCRRRFPTTSTCWPSLALRLSDDPAAARPRFGDDCWDLAAIADIPAWARCPSKLRVGFSGITDPTWRLCAKEVAMAMLQPSVGLDRRLPLARRRPYPPHDLGKVVGHMRLWMGWLQAHGVGRLADVTQAHCDAWLVERLALVSRGAARAEVANIRCFADYRSVLSWDAYPVGFSPWGDKTAAQVTGWTAPAENATPVIPDDVFGPLLAGALFLVQVAGPDVLAARDEWASLRVPATAGAAIDERLTNYIDGLRRQGRHVPELHQRTLDEQRRRRVLDETDSLYRVNLCVIERHIGSGSGVIVSTPRRRALVEGAVAELGLGLGGLETARATVANPTDPLNLRPWHREFSPFDVDELVNLVLTGCYIVVAALSGLRHSELAEMRRGCVREEQLANGKVRHRIHTQVIKGRDLGGEPDRWTVIEEVAQAFALVEALVDDELPFARRGRGFRGRYRTFLRWVNGPGAQAFLAPIPEHWRLNGRQFRRTLARLLGSRPHGVLAGKIHLKHLSVATSEGYFGRPGSSAAAFLAKVERERVKAGAEKTRQLYEGWQAGQAMTGPGGAELVALFAKVRSEMDRFEGSVIDSERRIDELLRFRATSLHVGPLNYCWFVDAARARCLSLAGRTVANAPLIGMCEPTRCANATTHPEHVPVWLDTGRRIDRLLASPRVPNQEKERLQVERERVGAVVRAASDGEPS